MSEEKAIPKDDYVLTGPMPDVDAPHPKCKRCTDGGVVMAVGRNNRWHWECASCRLWTQQPQRNEAENE